MAAGPGPTAFVVFAAIKFAGYSLAASALNRAYNRTDLRAMKVGATRTGIGVAAGVTFGLGCLYTPLPEWLYFAALIPIRVLEWGLLIRLFYEPRFLATGRSWKWTGAGIIWSFLLDLIAIGTALVVPGGIWVC
jgi:hypothetical protein